MVVKRTYKFRLCPTKAQKRCLGQTLELCRQVYNDTLAIRKEVWEQRGQSLSYNDTAEMLPDWKAQRPELKQVHSQVLQNVQKRVDRAFRAFFRRVRSGENGDKPGYPRFKGQGRYDSITYPQYGNGAKLTEDGKLFLSKIGQLKVKQHRKVEGNPKTVTIRRTARGKWYASITVEVEAQPLPPSLLEAGVDVGLHTYLAFSDGTLIDNPRFFRRDERELAKAQRRLSKCEKGTPEWEKARLVVARIHERIANHRRDFAHQLSRRMVDNYGFISFEKLEIKDMMHNHRLAKSITDAAWRQVRVYTFYKAEEAGRECAEVDPRNTSKMCSRCGELVKKSLSERVHRCPCCDLEIDRDVNAAINILRIGLDSVRAGVGP